jgi:TonB family protein
MVSAYMPASESNATRLAVYSNLLGDALAKTKDYASAELAYKFAISLSDQFKVHVRDIDSLSDVLAKQGKKQEAKQVLKNKEPVTPGVKSAHLINNVYPVMTELAKRAHVNGTVILSTNIDEGGYPKDTVVIVPLGFGLDESALRAVTAWRFEPTTRDGIPITDVIAITVRFSTVIMPMRKGDLW